MVNISKTIECLVKTLDFKNVKKKFRFISDCSVNMK